MFALVAALSLMATDTPPNLCSDPRNCRTVGSVEFRAGGRSVSAAINSEVPFVADNGLTLFTGESVVVMVAADGALTVESHTLASEVITPEKLALATAEMNAALEGTGQDLIGGNINPVAGARPDDRLRISMMQVPGSDDTVLLIENGYDRQLDYRAVMQVPGGRGPQGTTVCDILPNLLALEHWPHPIAAISLDDFRTLPADGGITCD